MNARSRDSARRAPILGAATLAYLAATAAAWFYHVELLQWTVSPAALWQNHSQCPPRIFLGTPPSIFAEYLLLCLTFGYLFSWPVLAWIFARPPVLSPSPPLQRFAIIAVQWLALCGVSALLHLVTLDHFASESTCDNSLEIFQQMIQRSAITTLALGVALHAVCLASVAWTTKRLRFVLHVVPETQTCAECLSVIPAQARKCHHCFSTTPRAKRLALGFQLLGFIAVLSLFYFFSAFR